MSIFRSRRRRTIDRTPRTIRRNKLTHQVEWHILLKECELFGIKKAISLYPSFQASLRTVERRFKKYKEEKESSVPVDQMKSISDERGVPLQMFSPLQEKKLAAHIRNIMETGLEIIDKVWIQREAIKFYQDSKWGQRNTRSHDLIPFFASNGWISRFKYRNGFNKSKPKIVKKVKYLYDGKEKDEFTLKYEVCVSIMQAIDNYGLSCVLNMDETPAHINEKPRSCWGDGTKNRMKIFTDGDVKANISILPTITADGQRLPMAWIQKGKTVRCLSKLFNIPNGVYSYFSHKGWINETIMLQYLIDIVQPYLNGRKGALLMDSYGAHWTPKVIEMANKMNLELIEVPRGMTATCQPLDMTFNAPFKAARERLWMEERSGGILNSDNVERTVMRAHKAYYSVSEYSVSKGFADICPPYFDMIMSEYNSSQH